MSSSAGGDLVSRRLDSYRPVFHRQDMMVATTVGAVGGEVGQQPRQAWCACPWGGSGSGIWVPYCYDESHTGGMWASFLCMVERRVRSSSNWSIG